MHLLLDAIQMLKYEGEDVGLLPVAAITLA